MTFPVFKKTSRAERIFILAALVVVGFILSAIVGVVATIVSPTNELSTLRISQISSQILTFVLPPLLYVCLVKDKPIKSLGFTKTSLMWLLLGILMMYAVLPFNDILTKWNAAFKFPESMSAVEEILKTLQEEASRLTDKMLNVSNVSGLIINLIMIAGLAALGEELLFRSLLQPFLIKLCKNVHIGIIITGAIFSIAHFEFYGLLPRWTLGILLGYMFYYSRSIWVPMAMHFVNNATAVVIYYLNNKGLTDVDVESFGQTNILFVIFSVIVMIFLFWITVRCYNKENKQIVNE